jgi:hypothetical protein
LQPDIDQGDRAATENANQTAGPKRRFGPAYCSGSAPIFVLVLVLVLSEAVLVLVIDQLTVLGLRFAHAVARSH